MTKKLFFPMVSLLLFVFVFSFTMNTSLFAEEKKSGDISDISLDELLNVEITTAGKQAEKISEIPASVVLVTREDIEKYGYTTLEDVLSNITGLYMTNDYYINNFGVRGFWSVDSLRNVIILVNDVQQNDPLTSANWLSQINVPVEAIDRIEVVRGPMSVIYGSGAFFGAINIFTNKVDDKDKAPGNIISGSIGSDKTYKAFVRSAGKSGDFSYTFNASYSDTEGLDVPLNKLISVPALLPYFGLSVDKTSKGTLENTEKFFNFSGQFKDFRVEASYTDAQKESYLVFPAVSDGAMFEYRVSRMMFGYKKEFSKKFRLDTSLHYFSTKQWTNQDIIVPNFIGDQENGATGYDFQLNTFFDPIPQLNISLGVEYNKILEMRNYYSYPALAVYFVSHPLAPENSILTQSIFSQISYKLSKNFKIVAGARIEQMPKYTFQEKIGDTATGVYKVTDATFKDTDAQFVPRFALIYSINEKNVVKFLYGKAINRPSYFQYVASLVKSSLPALDPENIQTLELNYMGQFGSNASVSLSFFHNTLENLLYRTFHQASDGTMVQYYSNVGKMRTNGAEMSFSVKPVDSFYLELSGTYQKTEDLRVGMEDIGVGYSPKFLGYLKASYFVNNDISLAVTGNYVGKMNSYYDVTIPGYLGQPVDGYFLLGANLRIRNLFGTGLFLNVRGDNLFDKEFRYPATSNNSSYADLGTIGKGIYFLVSLGLKF